MPVPSSAVPHLVKSNESCDGPSAVPLALPLDVLVSAVLPPPGRGVLASSSSPTSQRSTERLATRGFTGESRYSANEAVEALRNETSSRDECCSGPSAKKLDSALSAAET